MTSPENLSIEEYNRNHNQQNTDSKSLELLFEYTKFHIGVYITLTSAYVAIATLTVNNELHFPVNYWFLWIAVIATMISGLAGGVIISSITQIESTKTSEFFKTSIGIWNCQQWPLYFNARIWTYIEHTSFWIGLVSAVLSFVCVPSVKQ